MRKLNTADWIALSLVAAVLSTAARFGVPVLYTNLTAQGQFEQALRFRSERRFEEEEQGYRDALRIDPGHAAAHLNLSAVHIRRGDWADAAKHADAFIRAKPDDYRGYLNRAVASRGQGHLDASLADASRSIELWRDPAVPKMIDMEPKRDLYVTRSAIYRALGQPDQALRDLEALEPMMLSDRSVLVQKAAVLREKGSLDAALQVVNSLLKNSDNDWYAALRERANILDAKGNRIGAEADRALASKNVKSQRILEVGSEIFLGR